MKKYKDYKSVITLIAAYIVISDREIDNKELDTLYAYNTNCIDIEDEINIKNYIDFVNNIHYLVKLNRKDRIYL